MTWYELLIDGYSWFTNQLFYTKDFKISECINGELNEPTLTHSQASQIRQQLNWYQIHGVNFKLAHLNRSGMTILK